MTGEQVVKILRKKLYDEIWEISVTGVAKKYNASYSGLLKMCKESDIPFPPSGYWTKLTYGKSVTKTPLPDSLIEYVTIPLNSSEMRYKEYFNKTDSDLKNKGTIELIVESENAVENKISLPSGSLLFLSDDEREKVSQAVLSLNSLTEDSKIHKKILAYRSVIKEWNKNNKKPKEAKRSYSVYYDRPPFLTYVISEEQLPRVFKILDALYRQIENLGGSVNDDLSVQIRNERVTLEVIEYQDEIKHEITKQEAQAIIKYEDEKKNYRWAYEPNIRKYDYIFNGRLRFRIGKDKLFRDKDNSKIEYKLGAILIELYEESEIVRINREAREAAEKKREEEARLREEQKRLFNEEIEKISGLENEALDYQKACMIRAYIKAVEDINSQVDTNDELAAWIEWAKEKADWYDPIIAREDDILGYRQHNRNIDHKIIKKYGYYW